MRFYKNLHLKVCFLKFCWVMSGNKKISKVGYPTLEIIYDFFNYYFICLSIKQKI